MRGLASLTVIARPLKSRPLRPLTAFEASSALGISTNPNPRDSPLILSLMMAAVWTVPYVSNTDSDRDAIAAQLDKITAVQRQIQERVVTHLLEEKTLLTPDQQTKFNEIIRRRVCPLGGLGPESMPGACERHRECGRQGNGGTEGHGEP